MTQKCGIPSARELRRIIRENIDPFITGIYRVHCHKVIASGISFCSYLS